MYYLSQKASSLITCMQDNNLQITGYGVPKNKSSQSKDNLATSKNPFLHNNDIRKKIKPKHIFTVF